MSDTTWKEKIEIISEKCELLGVDVTEDEIELILSRSRLKDVEGKLEKTVEIIKELSVEVSNYVENEYPKELWGTYLSYGSRYKRAMSTVFEAKEFLKQISKDA